MDLVLGVLADARDERGYVSGFAITDRLLVAAGGLTNGATILVSSNAKRFEALPTPGDFGIRDVLAVGDSLWVCGEFGLLAVSRDQSRTWTTIDTGTRACLFGMTLAPNGAIWIVGDEGYFARLHGEHPELVDLETRVRLQRVYAIRDEIIVLGFDGVIRRWNDGAITTVNPGATAGLTGLVVTARNTWIVTGDAGFIARSPDGQWYSRVTTNVKVDLEGLAYTRDGKLIAVGDGGAILISTDDGRGWSSFKSDATAHLWCVRRFGGGVVIGADRGEILKLAPAGDLTWNDRADIFAGARTLDDVFADGPVGFIAKGLSAYLDAADVDGNDGADPSASTPRHGATSSDLPSSEFGRPQLHAESSSEVSGSADAEVEVDGTGDPVDSEAFDALGVAGDADSFASIYGTPFPLEAHRFFELIDGRDPYDTFDELRLDSDLRPDVGDKNLFELMVRRNQQAYLGTDLVEAFCGVFGIGSQGNGDTYHMEIYEWDGPRQVLHFDHETASFSGVFADSLDSLVYLASLTHAADAGAVSPTTLANGLRALHQKISPTWHFSIEEKDASFVHLDAKRRDAEFFFYRSRWICALLKHDGVVDIDDIPDLFQPNFNQVIPDEQLPARFEACEKYIPTALYAMWRAYLFDEPELVRYLEIGRNHAARLVRDAAKLIGELVGGRTTLGKIHDVPAWLAAFRALDLDPRRAGARAAEARAREARESARKQDVVDELARTPESAWAELAWKWLDDGIAHRALLEHVDGSTSNARAQIEHLDALAAMSDDERYVALPALARDLDPAIEAVLVGSLLRDDALDNVLVRPDVEPVSNDGDGGGGGGGGNDGGGDDVDADVELGIARPTSPTFGEIPPVAPVVPAQLRKLESPATPPPLPEPDEEPASVDEIYDEIGLNVRAGKADVDDWDDDDADAADEDVDAAGDDVDVDNDWDDVDRAERHAVSAAYAGPTRHGPGDAAAGAVGDAAHAGTAKRDESPDAGAATGGTGRSTESDAGTDADDDGDADDDADALGWVAIDRALDPIYHGAEPTQHFGTVVPYELGGEDPIAGISVYVRDDPEPHFHFVTYGFTNLFGQAPDTTGHTRTQALPPSGHGFELTFRLSRDDETVDAPIWALEMLQDLGRYVFETGNRLAAGNTIGLTHPTGEPPLISALSFVDDPELGDIFSDLGSARFVQVVGIAPDEYRAMQEWQSRGVLDLIASRDSYCITDPRRQSVLADWATSRDVAKKIADEGSAEESSFADILAIEHDRDRVRVSTSARAVAAIPRAMRGRLRLGRTYALQHGDWVVAFIPAETDVPGYDVDEDHCRLILEIPGALAEEIEAALAAPIIGVYKFTSWFRLEIEVLPTFVRDAAGEVVDVIGFADPAAAHAAVEAQRAREDAAAAEYEDEYVGESDEYAADTADLDDDDEGFVEAARLRARGWRDAADADEPEGDDDDEDDDDDDDDDDIGGDGDDDDDDDDDDDGDPDEEESGVISARGARGARLARGTLDPIDTGHPGPPGEMVVAYKGALTGYKTALVDETTADDDLDEDDADDDDDDDDDDDIIDLDDDDVLDDDDIVEDAPPEQVKHALAMSERALRLAPDDADTQYTHAMLLIDAERAGLGASSVLDALPSFTPTVRINVAVRLGSTGHARFAEAVDVVLDDALPEEIIAEGRAGMIASFGDVATETYGELGEAILQHAPTKMSRYVAHLPDDIELLFTLAAKAIDAGQRNTALALYERVLALPIPDDGDERTQYLMSLNNACVQAHAAKAFDTAARIADRAQPIAHENPYIYHSAACAYAAVGDLHKAFDQIKLAIEHEYEHLDRVETDADLGPLLEWPETKSLFASWHARREGN